MPTAREVLDDLYTAASRPSHRLDSVPVNGSAVVDMYETGKLDALTMLTMLGFALDRITNVTREVPTEP